MNNVEQFIKRIMMDTTPDKPIWNMEKILSGKPNEWNYVDGCVLLALLNMYKVTAEKDYFDFVVNYLDYYLEESKPLGYTFDSFNLDNINEGKVLIELYEATSNKKYKDTIELLYKQVQEQPRTKEGNFWHKQIYPNQVWLDGLYMVMPFYMAYETKYNSLSKYQDIYTQITNVRSLMFDEEKKLYYHGYDSSKTVFWASKETGLSKNHWLRSIGWFAAAMVDTLEEMNEAMFFEYRAIQTQLKELIDGMLPYLSEEHMWYQVVDQPDLEGNYLETSGSAMLAYTILKAVRLNLLSERYFEVGKKVFEGIKREYLKMEDGKWHLGGICLVSGLGPEDNKRRDGTAEYYISEKIVCDDGKGIAPFILAYAELINKS